MEMKTRAESRCDNLKVTKVEFVPMPDSDWRLKRVMELLLQETNQNEDGECKDEQDIPKR